MSDRKLLELAAKAAGIEHGGYSPALGLHLFYESARDSSAWNPLDNDGDALRLVGKLRIEIEHNYHLNDEFYVVAMRPATPTCPFITVIEKLNQECMRQSAIRRAIVRAAAEIGKATA